MIAHKKGEDTGVLGSWRSFWGNGSLARTSADFRGAESYWLGPGAFMREGNGLGSGLQDEPI